MTENAGEPRTPAATAPEPKAAATATAAAAEAAAQWGSPEAEPVAGPAAGPGSDTVPFDQAAWDRADVTERAERASMQAFFRTWKDITGQVPQ